LYNIRAFLSLDECIAKVHTPFGHKNKGGFET
jgi:hypothetical protein